MTEPQSPYEYDIVVSFAGEDRAIVEQFASRLRSAGLRVFYDAWNKATLWGKDLVLHLDKVYRKSARFCAVFCSEAYAQKVWPHHELRSALARAFEQMGDEYILPIRLDDTDIPGILPTIALLDIRHDSIEYIADLAIEKIQAGEPGPRMTRPLSSTSHAPAPLPSRLRIKRQFTDYDRDVFLEAAFEEISATFESSLLSLQTEHSELIGKFQRINATHFTARVYRNGHIASACGIRIGNLNPGFSAGREIVYSTEPDATNRMNEAVRVEDDGQSMHLQAIGLAMSGMGKPGQNLTPREACDMFWSILLRPLQKS